VREQRCLTESQKAFPTRLAIKQNGGIFNERESRSYRQQMSIYCPTIQLEHTTRISVLIEYKLYRQTLETERGEGAYPRVSLRSLVRQMLGHLERMEYLRSVEYLGEEVVNGENQKG
jgi:hypothetical protein